MPIIFWFVEFEPEGKLLANQVSMSTSDWIGTVLFIALVTVAFGFAVYKWLKSTESQDVEDDRLYFSEPRGKR